MDYFSLLNLKSITTPELQWLKIKPLTIFVGENSSGKSSIVRSFPLFKQSTESKTLGTVLWSGKYVDYGSFDESLNSKASKDDISKEITFAFSFVTGKRVFQSQILPQGTRVSVFIRVHGNEYSPDSYTIIEYAIHESRILIKYDSSLKILGVMINGIDFTKAVCENYVPIKNYSVTPALYALGTKVKVSGSITDVLVRELRKHVHHRTSDETLSRAAQSIRFSNDDGIKRQLSNRTLLGQVAAKNFAQYDIKSQNFEFIKNQVVFCDLGRIIDQVSDYLHAYFSSLRYITPLRAAADRYYRIQNTSIDELDPNGSNLAMFLHAKNTDEIHELNDWLLAEIGFEIDLEKSNGHTSIFVVDGDGHRSNIADTGFGFSQILPILIQIWQSSTQKNQIYRTTITPKMVVIEQPELHLHPRMQTQVGKMFCKALEKSKKSGGNFQITIETHSKEIVEAVGRCIEQGMINNDDVAIYMVGKTGGFSITESSFDTGGYLVNWPYGFFDGE